MSTPSTLEPAAGGASAPRATERPIVVARAALALVWAVALVVAIGNDVPRTDSDVPVVAAILLATYPLIDVVATALTAARDGAASWVTRANVGVSALAVIAVGAAAFGSDAGATLTAFGAWAAVSGLLQLGVALLRRHQGRQLPLIISGGVSTVAGIGFISSASKTDASLASLGGYMAAGAILFLIWAYRNKTAR
jgi:hypothetical protein